MQQTGVPIKRPLLPVTLLFIGGILASQWIVARSWVLLAATLICACLALIQPVWRQKLLYALIVMAGLTDATIHKAVLSSRDLRELFGPEPSLRVVRGELIETPTLRFYEQGAKSAWRTLARLEVTSVRSLNGHWEAATGRIAVSTPELLTNYYAGQQVEVTGVLAPPSGPLATGLFDYRRYLELQGIYYSLRAESERDWQLGYSPAPPLADRFRSWARGALALGLPAEDESLRLEWALALGWKTALTQEVSEPFVRAATYHIFAVDGLRMAIIFGIFFSVLRAMGVPRKVCGLVLLPVIWFYVALTGWPASAIRASVMLTIVLLGWIFKRPSNVLNSLFAAALLILIWQPGQLFQAGFQLSFFVVLCLILMVPTLIEWTEKLLKPDPLLPTSLRRRPPRWVVVPSRYVADLSLTSFAAWIGSIPLVAYYFNILTPVSTPANILAVPLCVLVLISNVLSLTLAAWLPAGAELFNHAGWFGMECIRISSQWFADWPGAYLYVRAPSLFTTCLYYSLLLAIVSGWLFRPAWRLRKVLLLSVALLIWTWGWWGRATATQLTIVPVNGAAVVHCDAPGAKRDLLIDSGPSNSVQFITEPFLRGQGVNRLAGVLLTHGDARHIGGTAPLLSSFQVQRVYTSTLRFRSPPYRRLLAHLEHIPGAARCVSAPDVLGDWTVLHPAPDDRFPKADDGAIVLRGVLNGTRVLLLSDLGGEGQRALLRQNRDLRADIVVAGLPAAGEPLSGALLEAIQPKVIIVADSEFPFSERAGRKLRLRLARQQAAVFYTGDTRALTLQLRAGSWVLRTMNGLELSSTTVGPAS